MDGTFQEINNLQKDNENKTVKQEQNQEQNRIGQEKKPAEFKIQNDNVLELKGDEHKNVNLRIQSVFNEAIGGKAEKKGTKKASNYLPFKTTGLITACNLFLTEEKDGRSDSYLNLRRAINASRDLINNLNSGKKVDLEGADFAALMRLMESAHAYTTAHEGKSRGKGGERFKCALKIYTSLNQALSYELENNRVLPREKKISASLKEVAAAEGNVKRLAPYYHMMSVKIGKDLLTTDVEKLNLRWNILRSCERDINICMSNIRMKDMSDDMAGLLEEYRQLKNRIRLVKRADRKVNSEAFRRRNTNAIRNQVRLNAGDIPEEGLGTVEEEKDGLSKNQLAALSRIDTWVVRNFHNGGVAAKFGAATDRSNMVNRLMSMSRRKRLFIYYLVETKARKNVSLQKFGESQTAYVPNLDKFKDNMLPTRWKFYSRLSGSYIYWNKLEESMRIADKCNAIVKAASEIYTDRKVAKPGAKDLPLKQTECFEKLLADLESARRIITNEEELKVAIAKKQVKNEDVKADTAKLNKLVKERALLKVSLRDDFDRLIEIEKNMEPLKGKSYSNKAVDFQTYITDIPGHLKTADDVGIVTSKFGFSVEATNSILSAFDLGSKGLGVITSALGAFFTTYALFKSNSMSWYEVGSSVFSITASLGVGINAGTAAVSGLFTIKNVTTEFLTSTVATSAIIGVNTAVSVSKGVAHLRNGYHRSKASKLAAKKAVPDRYLDNLTRLNRRLGKDQKISTYKNLAFSGATIAAAVFMPPLVAVVGAGAAVSVLIEKKVLSRRAKYKQAQLVDDFFGVDTLYDEVKKNIKHRLSNSEQKQLRVQIRKRVAEEAGFTSVKTAAVNIASRYANYLLEGAHRGGEDAQTYIEFIKGLGLYYREDKADPKNNRPLIPDMVKKMCF